MANVLLILREDGFKKVTQSNCVGQYYEFFPNPFMQGTLFMHLIPTSLFEPIWVTNPVFPWRIYSLKENVISGSIVRFTNRRSRNRVMLESESNNPFQEFNCKFRMLMGE